MSLTIGVLKKARFGPFTLTTDDILYKHYTLQGESMAAELQYEMRKLLVDKELLKLVTDALKEQKLGNRADLNIDNLNVTSAGVDEAKRSYEASKKIVYWLGRQYDDEREKALRNLQSEQGKLTKIKGDLGEYITKLISSGMLYAASREKKAIDELVKGLEIQGGQHVTHGKNFAGNEYKISSPQKADVTFSIGINDAIAGISAKNYQNLYRHITLYGKETNLMGLISEWDNNSVNGLKFLQSLALYGQEGYDKEARQTGESFMAIQAFMGAAVNNLNASDTAQYFALYTNNTAYVKFIPSLLKRAFENNQGTIYQLFKFNYNPSLKDMGNTQNADGQTVDEYFRKAHVGIKAKQTIINLIMAEVV